MFARAFYVIVFLVANIVLFRLELAGYRIVKTDWPDHAGNGDATSESADARACAPAPASGTTSFLTPGGLRNEATAGTLTLHNERADQLVLVLGDEALHDLSQLVVVAPSCSATIRVRPARYGVALLAGKTWCGLSRGYVGGQHLTLPNGVTVKPDGINELSIGTSTDNGSLTAQYRYDAPEPLQVQVLDLEGTSAGVLAQGEIDGKPLTFLLDTGSPTVTLSPALATQVGLKCKRPARYVTPAGAVAGCAGLAPELRFGPYRLVDVDVSVIPGTPQPLLGMNVLRKFQLLRHGQAVRITPFEDTRSEVDGTLPPLTLAPIVPWMEAPPAQEQTAADVAVVQRHARTMLAGAAFTLLLHIGYMVWSLKAFVAWLSDHDADSDFVV